MSRKTAESATPDAPTTPATPVDPYLALNFVTRQALTDLFAFRTKQKVPKLEDFDTRDWIEWRALQRCAPVDASTRTRDGQEYYAPDPLEPGKVFLGPDNKFWRSFETQGYIERVNT